MFGSLRLALAIMVALSHIGTSFFGHNIGVPAVVVFFILSGFVVANLLANKGDWIDWRHHVGLFYYERLLRLLPLYLFFMAVAAWARPLDLEALSPWKAIYVVASNFLIVPLNYQMLTPWLTDRMLVPPAWSLGLELQFYLLAPLVCLSRKVMHRAMIVSVLFYIAVSSFLSLPYSDWLGYRFIVATLFMFLSGACLYQANYLNLPLLKVMWGGVAGLLFYTVLGGRLAIPYVLETTMGYLIGLPLVMFLARIPRHGIDEWLGRVAYGVFLCHFSLIWAAERFGLALQGPVEVFAYIVASIILSLCGHLLVEVPLVHARHRIRATMLRMR